MTGERPAERDGARIADAIGDLAHQELSPWASTNRPDAGEEPALALNSLIEVTGAAGKLGIPGL